MNIAKWESGYAANELLRHLFNMHSLVLKMKIRSMRKCFYMCTYMCVDVHLKCIHAHVC